MSEAPLLERLILALAPRWGEARARARYRAHAYLSAGSETLRYAAAAGARGWLTPATSASAETAAALVPLRNRARDLVRNNGYAMTAVRKLAGHMVGKGLRPRAENEGVSARQRQRHRQIWNEWAETCDIEGRSDFYGLQNLAARTVIESGEALILWRYHKMGDHPGPVPLTCEVLEPDYLDTAKSQPAGSGGRIIQGVEYDALGRRVAYWLFDEHPGDAGAFTRRGSASRRVPADLVDHVFEVLRPGQVRGVSWFAPVAHRLRDAQQYEEAELIAKKIEACFAVFVKRPSFGEDEKPLAATPRTGAPTIDGKRILEELRPGAVYQLFPDEEIETARPATTEGFADYMRAQLHAIAAGLGIPYANLTGDVADANYSSMREGKLDFWALLDGWQHQMLIPQLCRPAERRVCELARRLGLVGQAPVRKVWSIPLRPWVDPLKDVQARERAVRNGFELAADVIAERGGDPETRIEDIADWNRRLDEAAVVLDSDPRTDRSAPVDEPTRDDDDDTEADEAEQGNDDNDG